MLVLTRKASEAIQVGDGIVIRILGLGTKNVKIGIEAPKDVRVLRGELCEPSVTTLSDVLEQRKSVQAPHTATTSHLTRVLTKAG